MHYYSQWRVADLAEAVLELRRIALPAQDGRERWYVWPPEDPRQLVEVGLDPTNVDSVRVAYDYDREERSDIDPVGIEGAPDEPLWLTSIHPSIVWTRVVPTVLAHSRGERPGPEDPPVLDLTGWALSDRRPTELVRARPTGKPSDGKSAAWSWCPRSAFTARIRRPRLAVEPGAPARRPLPPRRPRPSCRASSGRTTGEVSPGELTGQRYGLSSRARRLALVGPGLGVAGAAGPGASVGERPQRAAVPVPSLDVVGVGEVATLRAR